jgi:hypothetical protein
MGSTSYWATGYLYPAKRQKGKSTQHSTFIKLGVLVQKMIWPGCLLALDKMPGVSPIAKSILLVMGKDVASAWNTDMLCAGLQGGIHAAIQAAQAM